MKNNTILLALIPLICLATIFLLGGNVSPSLADEGHLWYGAIETAQGATPILDFRSYDPGRYYWTSTLGYIFGDGIVGLRLSGYVFIFLCCAVLIHTLLRSEINKLSIALITLTLILLSFPTHKVYEHGLLMLALFSCIYLIDNPSIKTYFTAGISVGIIEFFARNYSLYLLISIFLISIFIYYKLENLKIIKLSLAFSLGIFIGCIPLFLMFITISGFFTSYLDSITRLFGQYSPVLPTPIPWNKSFLLSAIYIVTPLTYTAVIAYGIKKKTINKNDKVLLACAFTGIPLMHHIVTRADIAHLAQGIPPFVIILFLLPLATNKGKKKIFIFSSTLVLTYLFYSIGGHFYSQTLLKKLSRVFGNDSILVEYDIRGEILLLSRHQARNISLTKEIVQDYVLLNENIWITPFDPGIYPILKKKIPVWDPYPLFPVSPTNQEKIIRRLQQNNVNTILVNDRALDGIESRRFSNTHDLVWDYFINNYDEISDARLKKDQYLFRKNI